MAGVHNDTSFDNRNERFIPLLFIQKSLLLPGFTETLEYVTGTFEDTLLTTAFEKPFVNNAIGPLTFEENPGNVTFTVDSLMRVVVIYGADLSVIVPLQTLDPYTVSVE